MSDYELYLSFDSGREAIKFPVLPEKIEMSTALNTKTYNISELGEVNTILGSKLQEISFECLFPASWFPGCSVPNPAVTSKPDENGKKYNQFFVPIYYLNKIADWKSHNKPMRLLLVGSDLNINSAVTLESFSKREEGGAVGDIYCSFTFKQYVFYGAQKVTVVKPATATGAAQVKKEQPSRPDTRIIPKTYTIKAGDNLWIVAKRLLGDGAKWKDLQKLNGLNDAQVKQLKVGQVIKLS